MSRVMSSGFPTRSDTKQVVQPQKMAIGLQFWIWEVEGLTISYIASHMQK